MHHDEVRQRDAAQRREHRRAQQALRQTTAGVHAALRTHGRARRSRSGRSPRSGTSTGAPRSHGGPERVAIPGVLRSRDERELDRRRVDLARRGRAGRVDRGRAVAEGDDGHGPLVHPIGADERGDPGIREAAVQPRGEPCGVGHREQLREHGARIPVHVPEATFAVAPPGAPRDAGDHEGGRTRRAAAGRPERGRGRAGRTSAPPRAAPCPRARRRRPRAGSDRPRTRRRGTARSRTAAPSCARPPRTGAATGRGAADPPPCGRRRRCPPSRRPPAPWWRGGSEGATGGAATLRTACRTTGGDPGRSPRGPAARADRRSARPTRGRARRTSAGAAPASRSPCLHLRASFVRSAPAPSWPAM